MRTPSSRSLPSAGRGALLVAVVAIALVACGTAGSPGPSATPGLPTGTPPAPSATPAPDRIDHLTGASNVVFRFEEGGGFVPIGFFATEAPIFTLYGDGTVIFKDANAAPLPEADGIIRMPGFRIVKLTEDQLQGFLRSAIADGGLSVARATYQSMGADLPTATFTVNAGGSTKTVSVMGLGMEPEPGPDTPILNALAGLGERLRAFGREVSGDEPWVPDRWRGVLTPDSLSPPRAWPWPGIVPADFVEHPEPGSPRFPVRTMSADEIAALGLENIEGGFSGLSLSGPDGKTYLFALRPLFPDEQY